MCNFACKRKYCPSNICGSREIEFDETELAEVNDGDEVRCMKEEKCIVYKDRSMRDISLKDCEKQCKTSNDDAKFQGRATNYGCIDLWLGAKPIP
jgi:hypothetical protein